MNEAPSTKESNTRAGILWMVTTMLVFVCMDTCAKYLVASYPTLEVVWARYFFQVLILTVVLWRRFPGLLRTESLKYQLLRSAFLLGATLCFFNGLRSVQVAEAGAIMYTAPLMVTAMAPFILKETVGLRRWVSIVIGFIGAIIIIRPGFGSLDIGGLWILGAATCYACYQISTRALSQQDSVLTTLYYSALMGAVVMTAIVPFDFAMPAPSGWAIMALAGLFGTVGHFCMIKAFTHAEASKVAPYSYTNLIWATLLGFVFFGTVPDAWTYVGAAVIIGSGLYILHRERLQRT